MREREITNQAQELSSYETASQTNYSNSS